MNFEPVDTIQDDDIVLTFTDKKFLPIFNIFYYHFERHGLDNLLVISLDQYTYAAMTYMGIRTILIEYDLTDKYLFWKFRIDIINQIFKYSQKNIIHTDVDCFWFKNILVELRKLQGYDLVGHIAYGHPRQIVEKFGFVMCCGLYYLKYNNKNCDLIDKIMAQDISYVDDQVYFNAYIYFNYKTISDVSNSHLITKEVMLNDGTRVGIIKNEIVSRTFHSELYCFHPNLEDKIVANKLTELKKYIGEIVDYF
jgi:hypothetical protein